MGAIISRLVEMFIRFPGIGPRQARRFVYFLLRADKTFVDNFIAALRSARDEIRECADCHRFFPGSHQETCDICRDQNRDRSILMVVEKDADLEAVEKADIFNGLYFILGSTVPLTEKNPSQAVRLNEFQNLIKKRLSDGLQEIVLAFSVSTEGDHTTEILRETIEPITKGKIKITIPGRGLSTGTELEYSDPATIQSAISHREQTK